MKKQIGVATGLTVLICAIFWVYTQWDLKRFKESLSKAPPAPAAKSETAPAQQDGFPQEATETALPVPDPLFDTSTPIIPEQSFDATSEKEVPPTDELAFDPYFDTFFEEIPSDPTTSGDFWDASQEAPYDVALVGKGFDDYNDYLEIAPEYAYNRLGAALREQYNDHADVDIIVETVRRSNNGSLSIDDAIHHAEAMIRLVSEDGVSPPEAVAVIADNLDYLREVKQLALESGEDTVHRFNFRFHFGE